MKLFDQNIAIYWPTIEPGSVYKTPWGGKGLTEEPFSMLQFGQKVFLHGGDGTVTYIGIGDPATGNEVRGFSTDTNLVPPVIVFPYEPSSHIFGRCYMEDDKLYKKCLICETVESVADLEIGYSNGMYYYEKVLDENGNLIRETHYDPDAFFEFIQIYEQQVLKEEISIHWNNQYTDVLDMRMVYTNLSFVIEDHSFAGLQYSIDYLQNEGSFFKEVQLNIGNYTPEDIRDQYGMDVYLRSRPYHINAMNDLKSQILTNPIFDKYRYTGLSDAEKKETITQITELIASIFNTKYKKLYINLDNNSVFSEANDHDIGKPEAAYYENCLFIKNIREGDLNTLIPDIAHELRHCVHDDIIKPNANLSLYDLNTPEGETFRDALSYSVINYHHGDENGKFTREAEKIYISSLAENIALQVGVPSEFIDDFCQYPNLRSALFLYFYYTQLCEADTFSITSDVSEMIYLRNPVPDQN